MLLQFVSRLTFLFAAAFLLGLFLFLACFYLPRAQMPHLVLKIRGDEAAVVQLLTGPLPDAGVQLRIVLLHEGLALQWASSEAVSGAAKRRNATEKELQSALNVGTHGLFVSLRLLSTVAATHEVWYRVAQLVATDL